MDTTTPEVVIKTESFSPGVMIDGHRYDVEGWMIVLAFALRGIPWAIESADDPSFNLRGKVKDYERRKSAHFLGLHIEDLERKLARAKREMENL